MAWPRSQPNFLSGPYLDRVAHLRKSDAELRRLLLDPATRFVPVSRSRNLIVSYDTGIAACFLSRTDIDDNLGESDYILLGEFDQHMHFAVEIPDAALRHFDARGRFEDLRPIAGELSREEAGLLAYARALVSWRERHRFCGRCGAPAVPLHAGHVLECSNPDCRLQQFPRIDPAVIVLVTDGERALLGRQAAWPPGRYSTIAGFVEPGESLEDAVLREVLEETGVRVDRVDYHSSQPWPFPSSLMLGFTAHAATTAIELSDAELEDARWLTRGQIATGEVALPTTHSISFRLIEDWYDAAGGRALRSEPGARLWSNKR